MGKILNGLFFIFSAGCMISCFFLFYQCRMTGIEAECRMGEEIGEIKIEKAEIKTVTEDIPEKKELSDILSEQEEILTGLESELQDWIGREPELQELQNKYELITLLEETENHVAREMCPETMYDKYFGIRQGELARVQGIEDVDSCGATGMLNSHMSGLIFLIGEEIWVQYGNRNEIDEELTASRLIIDNPELDFGYMGARAGMDFEEIQSHTGECEVQEGFMYTESRKVYYMEFDDGYYHYVYMSEDPEGKNYSWLTID